tara:strand:+ start:6096 stop:9743 length:3648 start_codon:yes stop_codon:yes gene_type:complete
MARSPKTVFQLNKPKIFSPSIQRQVSDRPGFSDAQSLSDVSDTNISSTSSFKYDVPGAPLKSTQQLSVDFSKFKNHTFFNSALAKTNVAFSKVVNEFPFDGSKRTIEEFLDSLTGFDRYIFNNFPKYTGYLNFSGTTGHCDDDTGTWIDVIDSAGARFREFSKNKTGERVIKLGTNSFSLDTSIFVPAKANDNQVIFQRVSGSAGSDSDGYMLCLSESLSTSECKIIFNVTSGSSARLSTSASFEKGKFNHVCAVYDRSPGISKLFLYINTSLAASSSNAYEMESINLGSTRFFIGSGSSMTVEDTMELASSELGKWKPAETFSGSIAELRFFHSSRQKSSIVSDYQKNIFAQEDLKLYYRFNEPSGSYDGKNVVLDSSGNSLHTVITNYSDDLRMTGSGPHAPLLESPLSLEDKDSSPILFPQHSEIETFNTILLNSASHYDENNPNMITRLVPVHYLLEGKNKQSLNSEHGDYGESFTGKSFPGTGELGSSQILTAILFVWAKFFDEMKMFVDAFSNIDYVNYDSDDNVPDQFLLYAAKRKGFDLPTFYSNSSLEQYFEGLNLLSDPSRSTNSLKYIQNQIWRRILINIDDIIKSKGTLYSVKALLRAAGLNPDSSFRIREYGGPVRRSLYNMRNNRFEVSTMLDFSGSIEKYGLSATDSNNQKSGIYTQGFNSDTPKLISSWLSGSRTQVGFPHPRGAFVNKSWSAKTGKPHFETTSSLGLHGISNNKNDGLFTSGSWTYEGIYRFPKEQKYNQTQSLARMNVTGTNANSYHSTIFNIIAHSGSNNVTLFGRPGVADVDSLDNYPILKMPLTGIDIFDGEKWSISFGRTRSDEVGSVHSSSYFLRCARQSFGNIKELYLTRSFFLEDLGNKHGGVLENINAKWNRSGSFIVIGSQSLDDSVKFINNKTFFAGDKLKSAHGTIFEGRTGHIRFWSKGLSLIEWKEHVRNFKSLGVSDPKVNFNFDIDATGSFERLICDISTDQNVTSSDTAGDLHLVDFSQNNIFMTGSGFEKSKRIIKPEDFYYSTLSPKFDEASTDNKVRIRGYLNQENLDEFEYSVPAPVSHIERDDIPQDDTRFTIEMSVINALNEDIVLLFSSLGFFDSAIGDANLMFSNDYPQLDQLRKIYFKRLTQNLNLKEYFEFFKWFDTSFTPLVEQLIPRKTKFLGINFVIEPHMLERSRFRHSFDEFYLSGEEKTRSLLSTTEIIDVVIDE